MHDPEANRGRREFLEGVSEAGSHISTRKSRKMMQSSKSQSRNSIVSRVPRQRSTSGQSIGGGSRRDEDEKQSKGLASGQDQNDSSNQANFRAQFYENYRKEAEESDKEFMKKHDGDLDTTLIFAGLFSAVTSAFIIQVQSQLQPDPNQQTVALLRVLIYTINSTALGGDVPTLPQPSNPPLSLIQVQALLYASLAASLFSAFLAMLGKQWLNRYVSIDMRGSTIERSQNRQRKLDGIVTWYFDHVMESLPLMLQVALLLLGCALSEYLWDTSVIIASVILTVTVFGAGFYVFIVVAGAIYRSCPYQTPAAHTLRFLWKKLPNRSVFFPTKRLTASQSEAHSEQAQTLGDDVTIFDFRCISWMLQTSFERRINESTLKFLGSVLTHPGFNNGIITDCLNVLLGCINVTDNDRAVVTRGSEELAEMAATCLLRGLSHRLVEQPLSSIPRGLYQRYKSAFPSKSGLSSLPFYRTIAAAHRLIVGDPPDDLEWDGMDPSTLESLWLAHNFVKIAWHQKNYGSGIQKKVDRWILRFSCHTLLWHPDPPLSVIADSLSIAAIELGCNITRNDVMIQDKSAHIGDIVSGLCSPLQWTCRNPDAIESDREPIAALFLGAIRLEMTNELQGFDARHQFLHLLDQIHQSHPAGLGVIYLDALLGCVYVEGDQVTGRPGSEQTASVTSICLLRVLSRTTVVDKAMFKRYVSVIPPNADFDELPCRHTMSAIHSLLVGDKQRWLDWTDYESRSPECSLFANALEHAARARVLEENSKVPRWTLRFVLHSLSQVPPPPTSVVTACLSIIAIDLGCDVPTAEDPGQKSDPLETVSKSITQKLEEMAEDTDERSTVIRSKRKALTALFPYVALREEEGQHEMFDAFLHVARASERSGLMWFYIEPLFSALLDEGAPVVLKRVAILISPHIPWWQFEDSGRLIQVWVEAASAVPYTDDIGQSVVDTLLQIACWKSPTIPAGVWSWLNKRPDLPPACPGRYWGSSQAVFKTIRALDDIEILTSYLVLVWSEWDFLMPKGFDEMCASVREDFGGEEMGHYRKDLLDRLGHVRRELGLGLEYIQQHKPRLDEENFRLRQRQYEELREILVKVDRGVVTG